MAARKSSKNMFREKFDLKLIKLVKDSPVLYDFNNPKYLDLNSREVAWQRIGDELKSPANDCKLRWINIRDVYRRLWRQKLLDPDKVSKPYKYEKELEFMKAFYKDISSNNISTPDCDDGDRNNEEWGEDIVVENEFGDPSDDSEEPIKKPPVKRRKSKRKRDNSYEEEDKLACPTFVEAVQSDLDPGDPVDAFLISIGATLKTFSPYH